MQVLASEPVIAEAWGGGEIYELSVFLLEVSPQKFLDYDSVAAHRSILYVTMLLNKWFAIVCRASLAWSHCHQHVSWG